MIDWSTGEIWLIRATMPIVPMTAVSASSSGMLAATNAPKVTSRMIERYRQRRDERALEVFADDIRDLLFGAGFAKLLDA